MQGDNANQDVKRRMARVEQREGKRSRVKNTVMGSAKMCRKMMGL